MEYFLATWVAFCLTGLVRNSIVYRYRDALIDECSVAARRDIAAGLPWQHRHEYVQSVSYSRMAWSFWRTMDSFYPDRKERLS